MITAAPYFFTSDAWRINSSSPSFIEIEFTIGFPCVHFRPVSMTENFDESMMSGSFEISGSEAMKFKNVFIATWASSIPSSMFTSMPCAPPSTWSRATDNASSYLSSRMSRRNFFEPVTFVRSPMFMKFESGLKVTASSPLSRRKGSITGISLGLIVFAISTICFICSGVVPQHPPTIFRNPLLRKSPR